MAKLASWSPTAVICPTATLGQAAVRVAAVMSARPVDSNDEEEAMERAGGSGFRVHSSRLLTGVRLEVGDQI